MRVFVTGATGFIGSAVVQELLAAGHEVVGLARSEASARALAAAGAAAHRGALDDTDSLRRGAAAADGVVHLAYTHAFSHATVGGRLKILLGGAPGGLVARFMAVVNDAERRAVDALGAALAGTGRPLVVTTGIGFVAPGRVATEDTPAPSGPAVPRASEQAALALAARGVRVAVVRLPPSVHGDGDRGHGFLPTLIGIARKKRASAYVGDGRNRWSAVHRLDAARLFRLVLEQEAHDGARDGAAEARRPAVYHGIAEPCVPFRAIADVIGRRLGVPVVATPAERAAKQFGWFAMFAGLDCPATSDRTREALGWRPTHPEILPDLDRPEYFAR